MRPPNLLFILADDMGWGDLSCYGRPDYRTPHLDALAAQGVRLTDCYAGSATCSPTRIAFLTGRYPARHPAGLAEPLLHSVHGSSLGLEPSFPILPRLLGAQGYRCGLLGKWHCGEGEEFGPLKSGFDEFYGVESTGAGYFSYRDEHGRFLGREGEAASAPGRYLTHALSERACDFIERHAAQPFYLSLHYTAPHWPWEAPFHDSEDATERSSGTGGGSIAIFGEMVRAMDEGIGAVMQTLRRLGLDNNTLVVFTSDNGGERYSYHYPLTGHIRLLREGGIRVPGIACWPGQIPAGRVCEQTAITMDWTATFLRAAGAQAHPDYPGDGMDLLPVLRGQASTLERTLCWRTPTASAVRRGPWKWLQQLDTGTERLFNLVHDIREYADFRDSHPHILAALRDAFQQWESGMLPRPQAVTTPAVPHVDFRIY